jgi:dTDP-4-amino-4,6-dideoxygalactose transaminase
MGLWRVALLMTQMNIPLIDLKAQFEPLREQMRAAIERVMDSQQFVLGAEVRSLEEEIARYSNTKHAVGCASGSDALLLALMALDIKAGDEVITSPFTFFATGGAIARLGARPVFVDIDARTYNIDPAKVEAAITPRTRALMPVHLYGQCADMDPLMEISGRHGIPIIEDAAQAIGAEDRGRRAGSIGLLGCFSFYPTKNLGGAGDGGMIVTNDESLAERLRALRVHGGLTEYLHKEVGINSRLDALQAVVLRVKLPHLDEWSNERRRKADHYNELFSKTSLSYEVITPFIRPDGRHIFHQYVVRVPTHRDALMSHLNACGIGTKIYYPVPLHLQECFHYLGYQAGDFPESERAACETFALPVYAELTDEQQRRVVDSFRSFMSDKL